MFYCIKLELNFFENPIETGLMKLAARQKPSCMISQVKKTRLSCFGLIEFKAAGIYLSMKLTAL